MLIKLNYARICIHRRPYKFTYESTFAWKRNIGKNRGLAMSRINRNIHSTAITPTLSIPILLPPATCSQLATCLKECSVCLALTPQLAVLPRCPLGQRSQMFWWWPAGIGSFISTSSATWKRLFSFSVFTEFFGLLPWTSFEQRSWQRVQLWHLFNRG